MLVIFKGALPVVVRITVCTVLVVPTDWSAEFRLIGERLALGIQIPVPLKNAV